MAKVTSKEKESISFLKVRKVKSPSRAFEFDAGIDFYVPEFTKEFISNLKEKNPSVFCIKSSGSVYTPGYGIVLANNDPGNLSRIIYDLSDENDTLIKFDDETGENYFILPPHSRIMIPSGIKSRMAQPGRALIAANKSGVATKHGLVFGAQVVDYTYKGEIHLSVINTSTKNVRIYENMKIIQFIEMPVFNSEIKIVEDIQTDIYSSSAAANLFYAGLLDDRGDGGFGSTDKK